MGFGFLFWGSYFWGNFRFDISDKLFFHSGLDNLCVASIFNCIFKSEASVYVFSIYRGYGFNIF